MISAQQLDALDPPTRQAMLSLMAELSAKDALIAQRDRVAAFKQALIDKLTHENAILRRLKYAVTSEKFCAGMSAEQRSLLEEELDRVKIGLKADLIMRQESTAARAGSLATDWYLLGRIRPLEELQAKIDGLTVKGVLGYAERFPVRDVTLVTLGPAPLTLS